MTRTSSSARRGRWRPALAATAAVLAVAAAPAAAQAHPRANYIVQLAPGVSNTAGVETVKRAGGDVEQHLGLIRALAVDMSAAEAKALRGKPGVKAVSPNAPVRPTGIDTSNLQTFYPFSVGAPSAWSYNNATGKGVGVAVIDTGIAGDLPDFKGADGRSRVIATATTNPGATTATDLYGHGTHVAGILAGNGWRRGGSLAGRYIGIAPDASLISIKAGDDAGRATVLDIISGLQFAVAHKDDLNIKVVNLSLQSTMPQSYLSDPLDAAVEAAYFRGLLVVAAAGNRGNAADAVKYAPANDPFALVVGGIDDGGSKAASDDVFASWSSLGRTQDGFAKPDIAAPGAHIISTLAPNSQFATLCPTCGRDGSYFQAGGTSMAAPVVSGAAAQLYQLHPDWTPDQVKSTLMATGRIAPNLSGVPELNAGKAAATSTPASGANAGVAPSPLIVNPATGQVDPTMSSWGMSSWSTVSGPSWAMSSWGCATCGVAPTAVDPTLSSWSLSSWSASWGL
jgi:serine protease AprX